MVHTDAFSTEALVTTNFARDTCTRFAREGEGEGEKGKKGRSARDRVENKTEGRATSGPERGTLSSSGRTRHKKKKTIINQCEK